MSWSGVSYPEQSVMNAAALPAGSPFLELNLESLDVLPLTRQRVLESEPQGDVQRRSDGTAVIKLGAQYLGAPLSHDELSLRLRDCDERCVVVIFGLGTGQVVRNVRARCRASIMIYEPDPGVLRRALEYGPLDLGGIPIVCNTRDLSKAWYDAGKQQQLALVLVTPGYATRYAAEAEACSNTVRSLVQRVTITKNTYKNRAQSWVQDIIDNVSLAAEASPFLALAERYKGVPAFIVGAGPSLDKNIALLASACSKGIVFATNSSSAALAQRGIEPQVLACIESIDVSAKLQKLPFIDRVARAFSLSASPHTLRTGKGPLLYMHESVPQYAGPLSDLTQVPAVAACGSVSTAVLTLAFRLGCSPIVLVGQDLAYSDGRAYASGTGYESSRANVSEERGLIELKWNDTLLAAHGTSHGQRHQHEPLVLLDAWGGSGKVATGPSFTAVQSWFEGTAALLKDAGNPVRLINATEGGIRLAGFEEQTLEAVLAELPVRNITSRELAEQAHQARPPLPAEHVRSWLELQSQGAENARRAARRLWRFADHAARVTRRGESRAITRAYARLEQAEQELRRAVTRFPLIDAWCNAGVQQALDVDQHIPVVGAQQLAEHSTNKSAEVARAIEQAAAGLSKALSESARRLDPPRG
jgi:hypothetical protein